METLQLLQIIWFILIGILFVGYSLLDGFDLGIGTLLPVLARDKGETAILFTAIGPVWDGNEVWLLTGGGALFAAFPHAYATVFSGFYLALMLVLFALIFRAVSLEFWSLDEKRRGLWKWAFVAGSALPSLLFGVALGNVIQGIPLNDSMEYTGGFFTLLRPFPLAVGLLGLSAILLQGCTYAALKTDGELRDRIRSIARMVWLIVAAIFPIPIVLSAVHMPESMGNVAAWAFGALAAASLIAARRLLTRSGDLASFTASSLFFAALWGVAGSLQFPVLLRASQDPELSLTIYNSSSSQLTLTVMFIVACIGMPVVIGYTIYAYRIFRGRVSL
ncbi:MAG: cytochrome d ubiquinol oxidase subunit II [Spirochaetes bacterium]|nr:cytochrome d ubiquinol oxidase subunit II [Spirochaetota bacterium]